MTKRFLTVLAMLSIAAMMMLSSCTAAGVECGLIGKWEMDGGGFTVEITSDDKAIMSDNFGHATTVKIKSVDGKEITLQDAIGEEIKVKYKDLSADSVKFAIDEVFGKDNYQEFKKVF